MYSTRGIETIATITELRSKTRELVEHACTSGSGVLIQKNNEPLAVLVSYDEYDRLVRADAGEGGKARKRSQVKAS